MSRTKAIMGSMATHKWVVLTVAGLLVSLQATAIVAAEPVNSISHTTQGGSISTSEQPDGRTRLIIKAASKPKFTTWKMERPSRVVVDITGGSVSAGEAPFDAGTFAVGNVSATASAEDGKTRVTMTLRRGADYQVQTQGNNIVIDVTPWEAPPRTPVAADPALLDAARKEAADSTKARIEAEARANLAEENAKKVVSEERRLSEVSRRQSAEQAARSEQAARLLSEERQRAEQARRESADQMRATAAEALTKLDAQRAALEESRSKAESARIEAERMTAELSVERAALERARKGVQEAEKAAKLAQQNALEGQHREVQLGAERAAKHLAKEQLALEQRRALAEASQKAAVLSMERLAIQKHDVESRQLEAERARLSALEAAKMLESDRQKAAVARLEAERLRTTAEQTERKARALLEQAEASQKQAELRQKQGRKDDAEASRLVALARQQTEQARATADAARVDVSRMEVERKQLASEREALSRQQAALSESEKQAAVVAKRASEVTAKAAEVQLAMARIEREKQDLVAQRKALEEQQVALAERSKANAVERAELDTKAGSFERAMKAQQVALAKSVAAQEREQSRLKLAEEELVNTKAELAKREKGLAEVSEKQAAQGKTADSDQASLAAAKLAMQKALDAHSVAEKRRAAQEEKLSSLAMERQVLESNKATLERELRGLKSELATAKAEVARLKSAPKEVVVVAPVVAEVKPSKPVSPLVVAAAPPAPPRPVAVAPQAPVAKEESRVVLAAAATRQHSVTLRVPSRVSRIDFVDEPSRSSVIIELEEPTDFSIERSPGRRVTLRLHHADLPKLLERSMDATQFFGPVRVINSYRDPSERGSVRVEVELAEMVPNRVRTDGSSLYWDFDKSRPGSAATILPGVLELPAVAVAGFTTMGLPMLLAQEGAAGASSRRPPSSKKRFTGRRIDLDFKGADIHNILRLLAEVGGVNIVTSDDVKGEVTIKMRDVPWDQALDVVLRAKTLGQVREGNLIRVAPIQILEKELEQEISKQKQLTEVMPTETRLIGVSYAEAKDLEARTKDLLSGRGKVSVDERTNNLIVSDVAKNLALVEELVRNLDTQTAQVVIEARIIEARSTFVRALGVQWGGSSFLDAEHGNPTGLVFPNKIGIGGGADDANGSVQGLLPRPVNGLAGGASQSPNYAVNLPAAVGAGSGGALGLTLGSLAGAFNLNVRLSALEQSGQVRILSSPRISTMDNVQASIEQGVAIPISVISAQGVQTVFVDAKLNLTVKPHVTNEGTVIMNVHVTRNEPDFVNTGARGDPTILKKEAKTVMLVRDGDTAVIGGIYQRNSGLNNSKVPFFADIPIVGFFFRNRKENDDRTEFLVFITPRIANRSRSISQ
jgi:type IV pilus assembly protein PilQ